MEVKVHEVDIYGEARLHFAKKIKGEIIEHIEVTPDFGRGAKRDVLMDLIRHLDNSIYDIEENLMKNKKASREKKEERRRDIY